MRQNGPHSEVCRNQDPPASTGSATKGVEQYSANIVTIVLSTTLASRGPGWVEGSSGVAHLGAPRAFVRSVAVHSMKTSFVSRPWGNEICHCWPHLILVGELE